MVRRSQTIGERAAHVAGAHDTDLHLILRTSGDPPRVLRHGF
jgi:hypothetical protein